MHTSNNSTIYIRFYYIIVGKRDSIHHHLVEVISETAKVL